MHYHPGLIFGNFNVHGSPFPASLSLARSRVEFIDSSGKVTLMYRLFRVLAVSRVRPSIMHSRARRAFVNGNFINVFFRGTSVPRAARSRSADRTADTLFMNKHL
jgi:hypothetical protein